MTKVAETDSAPSANLLRTLIYRPQLKRAYYGLLSFVILFFLFLATRLTMSLIQQESAMNTLSWLIGCMIPGILYIEIRLITGPLAFSKIHVMADRLIIEHTKSKIEIPFCNIRNVGFNYFKNMGGWFSILVDDNKTYRFTLALDDSDFILEAISTYKPELLPSGQTS